MTLVRRSQAEVLDADPASVITLLLDPEHTGGALTSNRTLLRDGNVGAPPHQHSRSGELFFILDGVLDMLVEDEVHTLRAGDALFVPPGTTHAFAPAAGHDADFLVVITPGKPRFDYYRLLDKVHVGEATWEQVGQTQDLYDNHYAESAVWAARHA
ncbi:cupin [Longispora fulva]|uniref:Mannose-6-phosphate isomerase-like protein (Cupin superfamily) n=1 Tax=Longispora fulva TaxID=619741 RepID=A0A8J7GAM0_9ACTN|nr:cupin domain-containing protein [Longispora fulva]MBG6136848.1 mannose-6-phosphate isomerase-like protein (cupin superfamily) [Longispora fulva]GIG60019.1 cupin [Longispora fulva]